MLGRLRAASFGLACLSMVARRGPRPLRPAVIRTGRCTGIIVFTAGGPVDTVARVMAQWLSEHFGQQFIVENRGGSGGNIGNGSCDQCDADGYTLLFSGANNAISASLYKKLPFNFIRDTGAGRALHAGAQPAGGVEQLPVKTVQELVDYCKANPGRSPTLRPATAPRCTCRRETVQGDDQCDMLHVPYRGSALAYPDIMSNKVQLIFDNLPTSLPQARGAAACVRSASPRRSAGPAFRHPAIAETVPGYDSLVYYGMSAPRGTPPEIVAILNKAVNEGLKNPKLVARLNDLGGTPKPMTPAEYGKLIADETEKCAKWSNSPAVSVD